jgi:hypothetical protein
MNLPVKVGLSVVALLWIISCTPQVIVQEKPVEVTRQIEITRQFEATRVFEVTRVPESADPIDAAAALLPQSLHATTAGMAYFYSRAQGGLEQLTNLPYDRLACRNCHVLYNQVEGKQGQVRCESCHIERTYEKAPPQAAVSLPDFPDDGRQQGCLSCHRRQSYEILAVNEAGQPAIADVHRSPAPTGKGMQCTNCHTEADTHGDGQAYNSLHESPSVKCEDCHVPESLSKSQAHLAHGSDMECDACHVQTVVSCYNCHINAIIPDANGQTATAFPYQRVSGWKFLVKRNGKIAVADLMTAVYTDTAAIKTFAVLAPYHGHSVASLKDVPLTVVCGQCHDNANVREYQTTGKITISQWNDLRKQLVFPAQSAVVVPVPKDYKTAFRLSFARIANLAEVAAAPPADQEKTAKWEFAKDGVDLWQMLYAEPLDNMPPQILFNFPTPTPQPK